MKTNAEINEIITDLVKINNDRITGYEKAAEQLKTSDTDLHGVFMQMADVSRTNVSELNAILSNAGEEKEEGTTAPGKIYRTWMDIRNLFSGSDRKSILQSCEFGEDAAQKAYKEALESEELQSDSVTQTMIRRQQLNLKEGHDTVKRLRDSVKEEVHS